MSFIYRESTIRTLDRAGVLCAVVAIGMLQWLNGLWGGFVYGGAALGNYRRPLPPGKVNFGIPDLSDPLSSFALYSAFGIIVYIVIKLIEGKTLLRLAALIPLMFSAFFLWKLKATIDLDAKNPDVYLELLRQSRLEQLILFIAFSSAALLHLVTFLVQIKLRRAAIR